MLTVGRDRSSALVLNDPTVSRRHAAIVLDRAHARLSDTGSSAGVWMDGRRIYNEMLAIGDQFQIGESVLCIARAGELAPAPRRHREPAQEPALTLSSLELLDVTHAGGTFLTRRGRVRDSVLGDPLVAIKFLSGDAPTCGERAELRARFGRYLAHAGHIAHPGCVAVLGGDAVVETPYVIETFCPGASLRTRAARLSPTERLHVLHDVCAALQWLHARGLTHGCLTPGDILFGADNRARLANIGLAIALGASADLHRRAARAGFVAPECVAAVDASAHPAADLFALGAIGRMFCADAAAPLGALFAAMCAPEAARRPDAQTVLAALTQQLGTTADAAHQTPGWPIRLQVLSTGQVVPVTRTPFALGRARLNPADRAMSRAHAQLVFRDDSWYLESLDACTVLIDDAPAQCPRPLSIGDVLRLGDTRIRILT